MKSKIGASITTLVFIVGFASFVLAGMTSGSYRIPTSVFSGSGPSASSGSYHIESTVGQPSCLMDQNNPPISASYELYPGFWYTIKGGLIADTDEDGVLDVADNCLDIPNGPDRGTCIEGTTGEPCMNNSECGTNGLCSMAQEDTYPPQGNGIGDVCDCECDFDCDGDVDADDVGPFLVDFGRFEFNNPCVNDNQCNGDCECDGDVDAVDVEKFLEDFGRFQFNNPCPACVTEDWCVY